MVELKEMESIYLEEYDVNVKRMLSYDQIQQIINAVTQLETWMEREVNIDILLLFFCTDIGQETIEAQEESILYTSGLVDAVRSKVKNLKEVYRGIAYTESVGRGLKQISNELPKLLSALKEVDLNRTESKQ